MHSVRSMDTGVSPIGQVMCPTHTNKLIEYFCKNCQALVCPKCMFETHNGHELAQLEEVTAIVRENVTDLRTLMDNTRRVNDDNLSFIEHRRSEISRMKDQQIYFIDYGFSEVIKKLEEKREQLKADFLEKYEKEEARFNEKLEILEIYNRDQNSIEAIYEDLNKFLERATDAKILTKLTDISEFI